MSLTTEPSFISNAMSNYLFASETTKNLWRIAGCPTIEKPSGEFITYLDLAPFTTLTKVPVVVTNDAWDTIEMIPGVEYMSIEESKPVVQKLMEDNWISRQKKVQFHQAPKKRSSLETLQSKWNSQAAPVQQPKKTNRPPAKKKNRSAVANPMSNKKWVAV